MSRPTTPARLSLAPPPSASAPRSPLHVLSASLTHQASMNHPSGEDATAQHTGPLVHSAGGGDWWGETILLADQASTCFGSEADEPGLVHSALSNLTEVKKARRAEVDRTRDRLRQMARELEAWKQKSVRPGSVAGVDEHREVVGRLDQEHFGFAKQIRDLEGVIASATAQLARLRDEARNVDAQDVEADVDDALDSTVLRNRLYHDLGFLPVPNEVDPLDPPTKVLVRSDPSQDARVVKVEKAGENPFLLANYVWDLVSA